MLKNLAGLLLGLLSATLHLGGTAQQIQLTGNEGFAAPSLPAAAPAPGPFGSALAAAAAPGLEGYPPAGDFPSSISRDGQSLQLRVHAYRNFQPHVYPGRAPAFCMAIL